MLRFFLSSFFVISSCYLFNSCNSIQYDTKQRQKYLEDYKAILKQNLLGKWGGLGENKPIWDIKKDSIFYFDSSKSYAHKVVGKDLIIQYENTRVVFRNIQVNMDTLFFIEPDSGLPTTAYRFN